VWAELGSEWVVEVETGRRSGGLGVSLKDDVKYGWEGAGFSECSEVGSVESGGKKSWERAA